MRLLSFSDVHAPYVLHLADDRPILLDELIQGRTYRGLLLGLPEERHVPMVVEQVVERARQHFGDDPAPHVLEYELIDYEQVVGASHLGKDGGLSPSHEPPQKRNGRRLPLVTCMASFMCPVTVKPPEGIGVFAKSVATVIWFQENFGLPMGDCTLKTLRNMDWLAIAADDSD